MLRVLTLATLYPSHARPGFGGFVEAQTRRLAERPDVDLRVIAPVGLPPPPFDRPAHYAALRNLPRCELWNGVEVHRPRFRILPNIGGALYAKALAWEARSSVLDMADGGFVPDVIDAEFFYPDGAAAAWLGRNLAIPVSIKARGSDIDYWGTRRDTRAQVRRAAHAADGLLAVSEALADRMVALGLPRPRVHYTGVDLDRFRPVDRTASKLALGVEGPLVVSVGNLVALKGHDMVIEAVASLPGVTLLIAGEGPERRRLEAIVANSGATDRIRLVGAVPHTDMPRLLAAADVMALASQREGLANVWVEALACGTPVVAPDIGSAGEVIDRAAAGRIVARTSSAFALAIRTILDTPPAPAASREAALRFGWDRNTSELFEHLRGLVAARPLALRGNES